MRYLKSPVPAFHCKVALPEPEFLWKIKASFTSPVWVEPRVQVVDEVEPPATVPERVFAVI